MFFDYKIEIFKEKNFCRSGDQNYWLNILKNYKGQILKILNKSFPFYSVEYEWKK